MDENLASQLCRMMRQDADAVRLLISVATIAPLIIVAWVCFLAATRWVNEHPESRQLRLLWVSLWTVGFGCVMFCLFALVLIRPRLFH